MLNTDFVKMGDCVGRPRGLQRIFLDAICRWTGHLLWRSMNTSAQDPDGSLPVYGSYCKRCYVFGFVRGDYRS